MTVLGAIRYKLALAHGLATRRRFLKACQRTQEVQAQLLARILRAHRQTAFGTEHGFARQDGSASAYRAAVPVRDFEGHRPWIDRIVAGESGVLYGKSQRLIMFNQTSGTTAEPKLIPVTSRWLASYRRTSLLWGVFAVADHPEMFEGKILHITGGLNEGHTALGVPIGSASAVHASTQKRVVRGFYAAPSAAFHIKSYDDRYYTLARFALAESISLVATANPSTVMRLVQIIDRDSERLIRDIHDGTLAAGEGIGAELMRRLAPSIKADPARARELSRLRSASAGQLLPRDYWPALAFLACWQGGPLTAYFAELPRWFRADLPVRDIGLLASEARMTVPLADGTASGALDIQSHFFEFIPIEDADTENPRTLLAHEVEIGERYLVAFTTWAGLYRYDIADVVKVTGFIGTNPLVAFQNKGRHMTSLTGEKLAERQVSEAVVRAGAALGASPSTFVVWPEMRQGQAPGYVLALADGVGGADNSWAKAADRELCEQNVEYQAKRESARLGPLRIERVEGGAFERARTLHLSRAGTPEQYKHVYLCPDRPAYLERGS